MSVKKIYKSLDKADDLRGKTDNEYYKTLLLIIPFLKFDPPSEWDEMDTYFHVEYQPSDGIVLADNDRVYSMKAVIDYINENGSFKSYEDLKTHCSI